MKGALIVNALLFAQPAVASEADYQVAVLAACSADEACRLEEGLPAPEVRPTIQEDDNYMGLFPKQGMPLELLELGASYNASQSQRLSEAQLQARKATLMRELEGLEEAMSLEDTKEGMKSNCDAPCTFKRHTSSCRQRVQWLKDHRELQTMKDPTGYNTAINMVNNECRGQCECDAYDFGGVYPEDVVPPLTKLICTGLDTVCPPPTPAPKPRPRPRPAQRPRPAPTAAPTAAPKPKPSAGGTDGTSPSPVPPVVTAAPTAAPTAAQTGKCSSADLDKIQSLGGGSAPGSFPATVSKCAKASYSLWHGLSTEKDSACLQKELGISKPCAKCFNEASAYGIKYCKLACIKSWCSESCLSCSGGYDEDLRDCVGGNGDLPKPTVCVKGKER